MSEKELLRDLELVYDNEKLRAKVYGFMESNSELEFQWLAS